MSKPFKGVINIDMKPRAFTGGTIKQVVVDLSDEEYHNFELEAQAKFSRD